MFIYVFKMYRYIFNLFYVVQICGLLTIHTTTGITCLKM